MTGLAARVVDSVLAKQFPCLCMLRGKVRAEALSSISPSNTLAIQNGVLAAVTVTEISNV